MLVKGLHAAALRPSMSLFQFVLFGSSKRQRNKQYLPPENEVAER